MRNDIRKYKHTKIEREILERANKHLAEMRREFLKSDFQNAAMEKPVEFEIKDYDEALKNSKYPQTPVQEPILTKRCCPPMQPTHQSPKLQRQTSLCLSAIPE